MKAAPERASEPGLMICDQLLEDAVDALIVVGPDGEIQYLNENAERLFGYASSEILGGPVETLLPHEEPRDLLLDKRALDLAGRRKDGGKFPVEVSLAPLPDGFTVASIRERGAVPTRVDQGVSRAILAVVAVQVLINLVLYLLLV